MKYQNLKKPTISRSFRSFIAAYQPKLGFIITQEFSERIRVEETDILFIPLHKLKLLFAAMALL